MTAPITGPYTTSSYLLDQPHWLGGTTPKRFTQKRKWRRQAKPYDLPLEFDLIERTGTSTYDSKGPYGNYFGSDGGLVDLEAMTPDFPAIDPNTYNQAYARFVDAVGAAVELGVATAEGREAMSMITRRLTQMANFTRHVATGRLGLAASDLGLTWTGGRTSPKKGNRRMPEWAYRKPQRGREAARRFSSTYLEFHFGWSPLMKDIYDAMEVFDNPIKPHRIKTSAHGVFPGPFNVNTVTQDSWWTYYEYREGTYEQTVKLQADLVITNLNLAMMQQVGLANPAKIAWELVPFSFVLDWFVNVGDYLGSLTDFAGVELLNAHRTIFTRYAGSGYKYNIPFNPSTDNTVLRDWNGKSVHCFRRLGIGTGPTIRLRAPKPWGISRGLAAASLLMQRFPRQVIDANAVSIAKSRTAFRANVFPQFYGKYF